MKFCNKCKTEKPFDNFHKDKTHSYGLSSYCKKCMKFYSKKYREENREGLREKDRIFYQENKDRLLPEKRKYREKNREKYNAQKKIYNKNNREKINSYIRNRYNTDVVFKLRQRISTDVRHGLNQEGSYKNGKTWKILSYTPQQLKEHIESQFEDWMSWENHGEWHIDHIIPQSKLSYDSLDHPNFQKCWALSNLRPLCATKNMRKGNKTIDE